MKHVKKELAENDPGLEEWKSKPAKKTTPKNLAEGYLLKIQLCDVTPPIWRSFSVPADITLADLHTVLQIIMGWTNSHLHGFRDEQDCYGPADQDLEDQIDEKRVLLNDIFKSKSSTLYYEYDFGDGWEHIITCKAILTKETEIAVTDGKRACPPEDCGGAAGYCLILESLSGPNREEENPLLPELDEDFDPDTFSADEINRKLTNIL